MKTFLAFTTGLLSGILYTCYVWGTINEEESKEAEEVEA